MVSWLENYWPSGCGIDEERELTGVTTRFANFPGATWPSGFCGGGGLVCSGSDFGEQSSEGPL